MADVRGGLSPLTGEEMRIRHKAKHINAKRAEAIFPDNALEIMNAKQHAKIIHKGLRNAGIDFVATLPDEKVVELIKAVNRDTGITHVRLSREEEGVGICAGAYLTGKKCALIMQNGGFLNSCNALTSTSLMFEIPLLLLIYYAGDIGDRGFTTVGSVTEPVLGALGIRTYVLRKIGEAEVTLVGAQTLAEDSKRPVAVLLTKSVLGVG